MSAHPRRRYVRQADFPLSAGQRQLRDWLSANRGFYADFRTWLYESGYSESALYLYGLAARLVFSQIDKPYWMINLEADLDRRVRQVPQLVGRMKPREVQRRIRSQLLRNPAAHPADRVGLVGVGRHNQVDDLEPHAEFLERFERVENGLEFAGDHYPDGARR